MAIIKACLLINSKPENKEILIVYSYISAVKEKRPVILLGSFAILIIIIINESIIN